MKHRARTIRGGKPEISASTRRRIDGGDDHAINDETDRKPNGDLAVSGSVPLSDDGTHELAALVEELLDAHMDTIELMSEAWPRNDREVSHVRYLQALYRYGQATTAAPSVRHARM